MDQSSHKLKKSLHNNENIRLLEIIGLSKFPLSGKQIMLEIEKKFPGSNSRYVYERIKELTPERDEVPGERLFSIDDNFSKDKCEKIIRKLKKSFANYLKFYEFKWDESRDKNAGLSPKNGSLDQVTIRLKDYLNNEIRIEIDKTKKTVSMIVPYSDGRIQKIRLITKKKERTLYAYTVSLKDRAKRRFLYVSYNNSIMKQFEKSKSSIDDERIRNKAQLNRRYWLYDLNIRSLLLYSSADVTLKKIENMLRKLSQKDTSRRKTNVNGLMIHIDNVSLFPLILEYNRWRKILPRYFVAKSLREVSLFLKDRLDVIGYAELVYIVTDHIYKQITNYMFSVFYEPLHNKVRSSENKSILEYIKQKSVYLNQYEMKKIDEREWIAKDCKTRLEKIITKEAG